MSCWPEEPTEAPREEVFQLIGKKMGLFSVNSAVTQKQSSSSLGRNLTGLAGSPCRATQKVRSHSGSFSSSSASRKSNLKYPLKNPASLCQDPIPNMRRKSPQPEERVPWWEWPMSLPSPGPFASDSLIIKRPHLIKRGRNNKYVLFPQHTTLKRSPRQH